MAAKGSIAKAEVVKKIAETFGQDFLGEYDKKIYVLETLLKRILRRFKRVFNL